jgi:pantetheine-phosphate adenylyltransferase
MHASREITRALVPGTFDPITSGHLDVIVRSAQIFDEVVVGVASSDKKYDVGPLFTLEERVDLVTEVTAHLENVTVMPFSNLLVDFAHSINARVIVKGLRVLTDFEMEFQMAAVNYQLNKDMETIFIMSSPENMYLSSSVVREIASLGGSVHTFVPAPVEAALKRKYR